MNDDTTPDSGKTCRDRNERTEGERSTAMGEAKRWADAVDEPLLPPDTLPRQTVERHYCKAHRCVLVQDMFGRQVCPVCLVEEALP